MRTKYLLASMLKSYIYWHKCSCHAWGRTHARTECEDRARILKQNSQFLQGKYFNLHWGEGRVQECMLNFCNGNVNCKSACWADSDREMAAAATFLPPRCQQIFCHCQQTWLWDRGSLACSCIKLSRVQHCNKPGWQRTICQLQAVRGGTVRRQVLSYTSHTS